MKKMMNWVLAATLICGASVFTSCKQAKTQEAQAPATEEQAEKKVVSTELIRTSQSWDGVELPDYFQGRPELVAVKYVFPAGRSRDGRHHSPRREPRHEGLYPLHVLPLAEGSAPGRTASGDSSGITIAIHKITKLRCL